MVVKMPTPIMFETTIAVALAIPSCLRRPAPDVPAEWLKRVLLKRTRLNDTACYEPLSAVAHVNGAGDIRSGIRA